MARISRWRLVAGLQIAEALVVSAAYCIWLNDIITEAGGRAGWFELVRFAPAVALVVHFVLRALGAYDFAGILNAWRSSVTASIAWMLSTVPLLALATEVDSHDGIWRNSLYHWLLGGAFIVIVRVVAAHAGTALLSARKLSHDVAIIGTGSEAQRCAKLLQSDQTAAHVVDFIPLEPDSTDAPEAERHARSESEQHAKSVARLRHLVQTHHVRDVVVATAQRDRGQVPDLVRGLLSLPVRVLLWPPSIGVEPEWIASSAYTVGKTPMLLASAPPLDGWHWIVKDVQDRTLALLLVMLCSPALLAIALAIKFSSPGPVFFKQEREGYNGKKFVIFKFRSMRVASNQTERLVLTKRDDSRVFPFGAFIRRTSLDELPQLFNVLLGDMWLIGPRPHSPLATAGGRRYSEAAKQYMARFRVKPGITGWAQVNGWRGATNTIEQIQQRVLYDLYYIEHWSVWLDFQILLQTAVKGFVHQNAY